MTELKKIDALAREFDNDLVKVAAELKRLQSAKNRLKKAPGKSTYESEMKKVLEREEAMKQVRQLLDPKEKPVTMYEQADVDQLDYDQTVKAIKSIQSKKTNTAWLTSTFGDNDEFRAAARIEEMLKAHRENVKPLDDEVYIRKTDLQAVIETIQQTPDITKDRVLELLNGLV